MGIIITLLIFILFFYLSYKAGQFIQQKRLSSSITAHKNRLDEQFQQKEKELQEDKEKFKNNYRRFIAKKYSLNIPYEKTDFEKRWDKSLEFEQYILKFFDKESWELLDYTKDTIKGVNRKIISSSNPDFVVKHIKTRQRFAIECKYRKNLLSSYKFNEEGILLKEEHIKAYKKFTRKYYLVFIVLGLGGVPYKPEQIFLVPLAKFKEGFISKNNLAKYERDINANFIVKARSLR